MDGGMSLSLNASRRWSNGEAIRSIDRLRGGGGGLTQFQHVQSGTEKQLKWST